jgi:capsular polysaccharide biosynthesis protein
LKRRQVVNEAVVETALEAHGWTIVHPQKLPWVEQLKMLADCEHLAGFAGSALHTIIALGHFRGALHLFPLGAGFNHNFEIIAATKKLRQTMYAIDVPSSGAEYQQESFECGKPELIVDLLLKNT